MANKQCPICKMEQPEENQHCVGCKAVFDTSTKGATPTPPVTGDAETAPENVAETSEAETPDENESAGDTEENPVTPPA